MKLNCSINLHLGFYKMSFLTDSVDQDQTAQTVQSDVGFTLSVNLWDILFFFKNITLKWRCSGFNDILEGFFNFFQQVKD